MSRTGVIWPSRDDYQAAVRHPERTLKDVRLQQGRVETLKMGAIELPHPRSGNFGAVYKFLTPNKNWAVKVFDKQQPDREQRYLLIDKHLTSQKPSPHLVSFGYDPEGIRVGSNWYPTLLMEWVQGKTLDAYIDTTLREDGSIQNGRLCLSWAGLMQTLASRRIGHGDLQHGNILVMPDLNLALVDYDGMFVPAMRDERLTAAEIGLAAYQHPKRFRGYFDERLDRFAAIVILLTLASLTEDIWRRYPPDENCLIIRESDLLRPEQSPLLNELASSPDRAVSKLAIILRRAALGALDDIPSLEELKSDGSIKAILDPAWYPSTAKAGSSPGKPAPTISSGVSVPPLPFVPQSSHGSQILNPPQNLGGMAKSTTDPPWLINRGTGTRATTLTVAQQEVAVLVAGGYGDADIARMLAVGESAVAATVQQLRTLAGTTVRADLGRWAATQDIDSAVRVRISGLPVRLATPSRQNSVVPPVPAMPGIAMSSAQIVAQTTPVIVPTTPVPVVTLTAASDSANARTTMWTTIGKIGCGCVVAYLAVNLIVVVSIAIYHMASAQKQNPTPQGSGSARSATSASPQSGNGFEARPATVQPGGTRYRSGPPPMGYGALHPPTELHPEPGATGASPVNPGPGSSLSTVDGSSGEARTQPQSGSDARNEQ